MRTEVKNKIMMETMDQVNKYIGKETVRMAVQDLNVTIH